MDSEKMIPIATVSAPGKVILCGEHAVVYGQDALAMAISLRLTAKISQSESLSQSQLCIQFTGSLQQLVFPQQIAPVPEEFAQYLEGCGLSNVEIAKIQYKIGVFHRVTGLNHKLKNLEIMHKYFVNFESQLPIGKCLGSSAAFNTVLTTVLFIIYHRQLHIDKQIDLAQVNLISKLMEKIQHGTPSGIDNFVSTYGGLVLFNNSKTPPFRQINSQIVLQRLKSGIRLLLLDSGVEKNTKKAVGIVRGNYQRDNKYKIMIQQIGTFATRMLKALEEEVHWTAQIVTLFAQNHSLLRELGVSIPEIQSILNEQVVGESRAGKITGSGMGGYILVADKQFQNKYKTEINIQMDSKGLIITYS